MTRPVSVLAAACTIAAYVALGSERAQAHKPITSRYTFNDHVFPIFRDRCGSCHRDGGAAPMSLLAYKDAVPWAESIREEVTAERMPPWPVDDLGPRVVGGHTLSAREVDTIVTWATGGTPEGPADKRPTPVVEHAGEWRAGRPDLVLPLEPYTMTADAQDEVRTELIETKLTSARAVRLADLLPGVPSMVRSATIAVDNGATLAVWTPGESASDAPAGIGFPVPANARLRVGIRYKKPWQQERAAMSDRSRIGLYFAPPSARDMLSAPVPLALDAPVTVISLVPDLDRPVASLEISARIPGAAPVPLLRLRHPRPEWPRRYRLAEAINLPAHARIDATIAEEIDMAPRAPSSSRAPVRVTIDYVRR